MLGGGNVISPILFFLFFFSFFLTQKLTLVQVQNSCTTSDTKTKKKDAPSRRLPFCNNTHQIGAFVALQRWQTGASLTSWMLLSSCWHAPLKAAVTSPRPGTTEPFIIVRQVLPRTKSCWPGWHLQAEGVQPGNSGTRLEVREEKQHFYAKLLVTMLLKTILDYCFKYIFKWLLLLKKKKKKMLHNGLFSCVF